MKNIILIGFLFVFGISNSQKSGTFTDARDGKVYKTVVIGTQMWMAENLNVDRFRNGDTISEAKTKEEWTTALENKHPVWSYNDYDSINGKKYGKLYNWYAVNDSRGIAPEDWHVPTELEFVNLINELGGIIAYDEEGWDNKVADKLKSESSYEIKITYKDIGGYYEEHFVECSNCKNWNSEYRKQVPCHVCKNERGKTVKGKFIPKSKEKVEEKIFTGGWDGSNESGFSALPGGDISQYGQGNTAGSIGNWWSSSTTNDPPKYMIGQSANYLEINWKSYCDFCALKIYYAYKGCGFSVRCLKNNF
jgi:uncharacterized protein (TIGR02145 family)